MERLHRFILAATDKGALGNCELGEAGVVGLVHGGRAARRIGSRGAEGGGIRLAHREAEQRAGEIVVHAGHDFPARLSVDAAEMRIDHQAEEAHAAVQAAEIAGLAEAPSCGLDVAAAEGDVGDEESRARVARMRVEQALDRPAARGVVGEGVFGPRLDEQRAAVAGPLIERMRGVRAGGLEIAQARGRVRALYAEVRIVRIDGERGAIMT
jgi:hypothetical protein